MSNTTSPRDQSAERVREIVLSSDGTSERDAFAATATALTDSLLSDGLPFIATITAGTVHGDFTVIRRDDHEVVTSSLRRIPIEDITRVGIHIPWSTPSTTTGGQA